MAGRFLRVPSASTVIASIALIVALTGTALAAGLVNGDKLIKRGSLSGNRLRAHTLTRQQINVAALGTVPSARLADSATNARHAGTADSAGHASTADSAAHASSADKATDASHLAGLAPSAFASSSDFMTSGVVKFSSGTTTLMSKGSVSITATCTPGVNPEIEVDANATEAGTLFYYAAGNDAISLTPGSPRNMGTTFATDSIPYALVAPSGTSLTGYVVEGANVLGSPCFAEAYGIAS